MGSWRNDSAGGFSARGSKEDRARMEQVTIPGLRHRMRIELDELTSSEGRGTLKTVHSSRTTL
jgi:hypothetical protein